MHQAPAYGPAAPSISFSARQSRLDQRPVYRQHEQQLPQSESTSTPWFSQVNDGRSPSESWVESKLKRRRQKWLFRLNQMQCSIEERARLETEYNELEKRRKSLMEDEIALGKEVQQWQQMTAVGAAPNHNHAFPFHHRRHQQHGSRWFCDPELRNKQRTEDAALVAEMVIQRLSVSNPSLAVVSPPRQGPPASLTSHERVGKKRRAGPADATSSGSTISAASSSVSSSSIEQQDHASAIPNYYHTLTEGVVVNRGEEHLSHDYPLLAAAARFVIFRDNMSPEERKEYIRGPVTKDVWQRLTSKDSLVPDHLGPVLHMLKEQDKRFWNSVKHHPRELLRQDFGEEIEKLLYQNPGASSNDLLLTIVKNNRDMVESPPPSGDPHHAFALHTILSLRALGYQIRSGESSPKSYFHHHRRTRTKHTRSGGVAVRSDLEDEMHDSTSTATSLSVASPPLATQRISSLTLLQTPNVHTPVLQDAFRSSSSMHSGESRSTIRDSSQGIAASAIPPARYSQPAAESSVPFCLNSSTLPSTLEPSNDRASPNVAMWVPEQTEMRRSTSTSVPMTVFGRSTSTSSIHNDNLINSTNFGFMQSPNGYAHDSRPMHLYHDSTQSPQAPFDPAFIHRSSFNGFY